MGPVPRPAGLASAAASDLPLVYAHGDDLAAAGERFRAWGFDYGHPPGTRHLILEYFARPTDGRLHRVASDLRQVRSLGANTLRVYLEIKAFMRPPGEPRNRALDALAALLARAERLRLYLDVTGNLVWRSPPAWYDALPERARWRVQARFWRAVARTSHKFSSVLLYELTSEPKIADSDSWYGGKLADHGFIQYVVRDLHGRDPDQLARNWIRLLSRSIRRYDHRHLISIGLLPCVEGAFSPPNVADLLDVLLVHKYPREGQAEDAIAAIRGFANEGVPVVLGETAPMYATRETQETFLRGSRPYLDGYLSFFDGRAPSEVEDTLYDAWYAAELRQFLGLRKALVGAGS